MVQRKATKTKLKITEGDITTARIKLAHTTQTVDNLGVLCSRLIEELKQTTERLQQAEIKYPDQLLPDTSDTFVAYFDQIRKLEKAQQNLLSVVKPVVERETQALLNYEVEMQKAKALAAEITQNRQELIDSTNIRDYGLSQHIHHYLLQNRAMLMLAAYQGYRQRQAKGVVVVAWWWANNKSQLREQPVLKFCHHNDYLTIEELGELAIVKQQESTSDALFDVKKMHEEINKLLKTYDPENEAIVVILAQDFQPEAAIKLTASRIEFLQLFATLFNVQI